jgi:hypothetical protein
MANDHEPRVGGRPAGVPPGSHLLATIAAVPPATAALPFSKGRRCRAK